MRSRAPLMVNKGRHHREASHEQPGKGMIFDYKLRTISSRRCPDRLCHPTQRRHLQEDRRSSNWYSHVVFVPRSRIRCCLQGRIMLIPLRVTNLRLQQILQRVYKYGGQPFVRDYLAKNHGESFDRTFGKGNGKAIMHAFAGRSVNIDVNFGPRADIPPSLIGIGEVALLPLDVLKIKRQTNPEAFRGRGVFRIVADEGFALYRGWGWTMARNFPGSFAVSPSAITSHARD